MKTSIFALVLLALALVGAGEAFACSCAPHGSAAVELERAHAVFAGKVVEIKRHSRSGDIFHAVEVIFAVGTVWKGVSSERVSVFTSAHSAACGYRFRKNRRYIVYAYTDERRTLQTGICSRTGRLKDASEDLKELGPGTPLPGKVQSR